MAKDITIHMVLEDIHWIYGLSMDETEFNDFKSNALIITLKKSHELETTCLGCLCDLFNSRMINLHRAIESEGHDASPLYVMSEFEEQSDMYAKLGEMLMVGFGLCIIVHGKMPDLGDFVVDIDALMEAIQGHNEDEEVVH